MILVRNVFQAKYGRGNELVELFREARQRFPLMSQYPFRIMTDLSGPFFTVVTEAEIPSLSEFERFQGEAFNHPDFGEWFSRMQQIVESGRREFYTIEE